MKGMGGWGDGKEDGIWFVSAPQTEERHDDERDRVQFGQVLSRNPLDRGDSGSDREMDQWHDDNPNS